MQGGFSVLSLGRKSGQYIVIGENIVVKFEESKTGIKVFVDAPKEMPVYRSEVWERTHPVPKCILASEK